MRSNQTILPSWELQACSKYFQTHPTTLFGLAYCCLEGAQAKSKFVALSCDHKNDDGFYGDDDDGDHIYYDAVCVCL